VGVVRLLGVGRRGVAPEVALFEAFNGGWFGRRDVFDGVAENGRA